MATCKDCIHYEVCKKTRIMNPSHNYATECIDYKYYPRFVELPYSLSEGDKLKYIFTDENNEIRIGDDWEALQRYAKTDFS